MPKPIDFGDFTHVVCGAKCGALILDEQWALGIRFIIIECAKW